MQARSFSIILLSFVAGIWLAPLISVELSFLKTAAVILIVLAILYLKNLYVRTVLFALAIFCIAFIRYEAIQPKKIDEWIGSYNGKNITMVGTVDSEPEADKITKFIIDVKSITGEKSVRGKVLVKTDNFPEFEFGDKIRVKGRLKEPPEFEEFSYKDYLARYDVYSLVDFPEIEKTKSQFVERRFAESFWFETRKLLSVVKNRFEESIERVLPEPHASFMDGLILGVKKSIPDWLMEDFKTTGTTHIIALSGFNITIIVQVLRNLTKNLSRKLSFWLPVLGVLLFIVLTGAQASVVRAAIMGSMLLLAREFGRQSTAYTAIVLTAAVMIYLNPLILRFDVGFQLSFVAVLGIIYVSPLFEKLFSRLPEFVNENLSLTLAAQAAAAPIIIYYFGTLSLIAPISNILILPLIPFAMFFGFLAATMGMVTGFLGQMFGWISYGMLEYMIRTVGYLSDAPYASIDLNVKSPLYVAIYYVVLLDIIFMIRYKKKKNLEHES